MNLSYCLLPKYPGQANHTQCFLHMTNLIAKSLLYIFDNDKKKQSSTIAGKDIAAELEDLSEGLETDEWVMATETEGHDAKEGTDDTEGLVDLVAEMGPKKHIVHEEHIHSLRLVLVKVFDDCR